MTLSWLPNTSQGRMFGDYISTSVLSGGNAFAAIPVAFAPSGGVFNDNTYVPTGGRAIAGGARTADTAGSAPVTGAPAGTPLTAN